MVREEYDARMPIVRPGEFGDRFMVILSGVVDVRIEEESGPTPLATLRSGDVLSELLLLTSQRKTITAVAREDVDLYACTKETFRAALETCASLREQVCKVAFQHS
jgi:CRP-like cAMP-binding protein